MCGKRVIVSTLLLLLAGTGYPRASTVVPNLYTAAPEFSDGTEVGAPANKMDEWDRALRSFQRRDYVRCLDFLNAAVRKHPELPPARLMLARLLLSEKQQAEGRAFLEQAASEKPEHPGVYLTFAELALAEGQLTDAMLQYERAFSVAMGSQWPAEQRRHFLSRSHVGLATVASRRNDWASAKKHLMAWLEIDPKNGKARQQLAKAFFVLNEPRRAYEQLQQAVRDDATLEPAAVSMAWLYTTDDNLTQAATWMEYAVTAAPKDSKAQLGMASWLLWQGKAKEAQRYANLAAKLDPDSKDVMPVQGMIARHLKQFAKAERYFDALYRDDPTDPEASNQLALVLVEHADEGKRSRALQLAEMNVRLYPKSAQALSTLGWVHYRLGRSNEGERFLRAAFSAGQARSDAGYFLARVMADQGKLDVAMDLLNRALDTPGIFVFRKDARQWLDRLTTRSR